MSSSVNNSNQHAKHGSIKSYVIGFVLSIILTLVPFYLVISHTLGVEATYITILVIAVLQLLVQVVFFLHLNSGSDAMWNVLAFIFTIVVLGILVIGSLWIMYNLNYYMMDH